LDEQWQRARGYFIGMTNLKLICQTIPIHFAIIAFDACVMANLETIYELRHCTDYIIASELFEGAMGLNSSDLITTFKNQSLSALEIACQISANFIHRSNDIDELHMGDTITDSRDSVVIQTQYVPELIGHLIAFKNIFGTQIKGYNYNDVNNAWIDSEISELFSLVDLYTTIEQQRQRLNNPIQFDVWFQRFKLIWKKVVVSYLQNHGLQRSSGDKYHGLSYLMDPNMDNWSGSSLYSQLELPLLLDTILLEPYSAYLKT
jgi:hypothetical protein